MPLIGDKFPMVYSSLSKCFTSKWDLLYITSLSLPTSKWDLLYIASFSLSFSLYDIEILPFFFSICMNEVYLSFSSYVSLSFSLYREKERETYEEYREKERETYRKGRHIGRLHSYI